MSTSENTSKNSKRFDEVWDVVDGNEYLNIDRLFVYGRRFPCDL